MLEVLNVSKSFGGVKAVNGCSFQVMEGSITALIGPNGAGKSTVFNIVSGILKPDSGKVLFNGKGIVGKKPEEISNAGVSRLFQQARLFNNLTVKENLLLALDNEDEKFWKNFLGKNGIPKEKEEKVKAALKLVGLEKFEGKTARELSFGQKRLLELMRTVLNPFKLLMLDEPVAGVNPKLREKIKGILQAVKKNKNTVLLVEHDMNFTLGIADKVIVMDEGKVIAEGKPKDIRKNKTVLEAYLGD